MNPAIVFLSALLTDAKTTTLYATEYGITSEHMADNRLAEIYDVAMGQLTRNGDCNRYSVQIAIQGKPNILAAFDSIPPDTSPAIAITAIRQMQQTHIKRRLKYAADSILESLKGSEQAEQVLGEATNEIMALNAKTTSAVKTLASDRPDKVATWVAAKSGSGVVGIKTPWHMINDCLGGLRPNTMSVLGAYRGTGKSSLSRQIVYGAGLAGVSSALITLEDPSDIASTHIASLHGRFSPFHLDRGDSTVPVESADKSWKAIEHLPIRIYDRPSTISKIENVCSMLSAQYGVKLFVIDHIQYILAEKNHKSRNEEVANYSQRIAALAKRLTGHILVCSQLSRDAEKDSRPPRLSDLRDSGAIEADARQVLLLSQNKERMLNLAGKTYPCFVLEVAKNNYGRSGDKVNMIRTDCPVAFEEVELAK